jgi:hypothetical protein
MGVNTAELSLRFNANVTGSNDQGNPVWSPELKKVLQMVGGTLANQFDILFTDTRTVASATNDDLDLAGPLSTPFGQAIAMAEVVGVIIVADAANTTVLTVGNGTNGWFGMFGALAHTAKINPGGVFMSVAPDASGLGAVTAATADILRVTNAAGAAANYTVVILGRSA